MVATHLDPLSQLVHPVKPPPPHCAHLAAAQPPGLVVGAGVADLVDVTMVVGVPEVPGVPGLVPEAEQVKGSGPGRGPAISIWPGG